MKILGSVKFPEEEFEHIDEWVSNPDVMTLITNDRKLSGIEYHAIQCPSIDEELLGIDISRELRLLGCSTAEINRWKLIKKIERKTRKRCDDYL